MYSNIVTYTAGGTEPLGVVSRGIRVTIPMGPGSHRLNTPVHHEVGSVV